VGRWFAVKDADLPSRSITSIYFRRLWFQITRVAVLCSAAILPLWVFLPDNSKSWVVSQLVVPLLSPAVAALTATYYLTARLRQKAD
jgi:hypothetical protein